MTFEWPNEIRIPVLTLSVMGIELVALQGNG